MTTQNLHNYEIHEQLGKGGMGVVYKATDTRLGRTVALKFLPADIASFEPDRQRFVREATTASSLDHPNICTIHEIGTSDAGDLFIAMACYEGETFRDLIKKGPQPFDHAIALTRQVAEGLAKAHRHNIVHRDIKPGNLMLTADGIVKILDFGLARIGLTSDATSDLTRTGQLVGTIQYMAPEQFRGIGVDHRTDIWALGVVLYELLAGQRPFRGTAPEIMHAVTNTDPQPLTRYRPDAPPGVCRIVQRAMARELDRRYGDIHEMLEQLRQLQPGVSALASVDLPISGDFAQHASLEQTAALASASTQTISAIAVMPFENLSGDPENAYFSDGLTDDLIHALSVHKQRRVISRNSVHELRGKNLSFDRIRELLGVDAVIEGSVRQAGSRVRIVARLVRTIDGQQLWSEKFDRQMGDMFDLQDEISGMIHNRLEIELIPHSGARRSVPYDGDMETYELYMKGRHFWHQRVFDKSLQHYEEAIRRDPDFALAHAGLAFHYANLGVYGGVDPKEVWPKVRNSVLRALELDRDLPEAHVALGFLRTFEDWDWKSAGRAFAEAVRLAPGQVDAKLSLAMHLLQTGRFDEARHQLLLAKRLDPLSPFIQGHELGGLVYTGEFQRAIEIADKALETGDSFDIRLFRGMALQGMRRFKEALPEFEKVHALAGSGALTGGFLGGCYAESGQHDLARGILDALRSAQPDRYTPPTSLAIIHGALGEIDEGFSHLDTAASVHDSLLGYARVLPAFNPFRSDPRFDQLLDRIGLKSVEYSGSPAPSN